MPKRLATRDADFETAFAALLSEKREVSDDVDQAVAAIIADVRARGDTALIELSRKFDHIDLAATGIRVTSAEIDAAVALCSTEALAALELARDRISDHHERQKPSDGRYSDAIGVELGHRWTAVESAGLYVPGGLASYPSSVLMNAVPARVAVIGGGAIGCEFASTFADLGSQVTILEGLPKILPGLDSDVANVVVRSFKKKNIDIRTSVKVMGHTPIAAGGTTVHCVTGDGGEVENLDVDVVVVSVGRRPFADKLGLAGTAVKVTDRGFIEVDEYCRTGEPGVYAIGDIINTPQLAHVGYAEAILVTKHILGEHPNPVAYDRVPWAIYCHPEVAFSGPSEEAAREAGHRGARCARRVRCAPRCLETAHATHPAVLPSRCRAPEARRPVSSRPDR